MGIQKGKAIRQGEDSSDYLSKNNRKGKSSYTYINYSCQYEKEEDC